jgi:flagellar L-ring protein FlgH
MKAFLAIALALLVTGCTTVPPTNVYQPMTARPAPRAEVPASNGAIFQAMDSRPLFEDRRARYVGDIVTVRISENTSASKKSSNNLDRSSSNSASVDAMSRLPGKSFLGLGLQSSNSATFEADADASNNNAFSGTMTVTVIDVLPNGNLVVSGEKQLSIGHEQEFVRVSGVVNPTFLNLSNTIDSSKIADARIEYKSSGQLSEGMVMGWLARFFLTVMPF